MVGLLRRTARLFGLEILRYFNFTGAVEFFLRNFGALRYVCGLFLIVSLFADSCPQLQPCYTKPPVMMRILYGIILVLEK
jgi:hypothetical protein